MKKRDIMRIIQSYIKLFRINNRYDSSFSQYSSKMKNTSEAIKHLYSRQALPMLWDYAASSSTGSFKTGCDYYFKVIESCTKLMDSLLLSLNLQLPHCHNDNFWCSIYRSTILWQCKLYRTFWFLLCMVKDHRLFISWFIFYTSVLSNEIVANPVRQGSNKKAKLFLKIYLNQSFKEIYRF